jgi:hypothetical protein
MRVCYRRRVCRDPRAGILAAGAMERARTTWTDERLDDLVRTTERGFDRLDGRLDRLENRLESRIEGVHGRIDSLQRLMIQLSAATLVTVLATLVSVIVTRA